MARRGRAGIAGAALGMALTLTAALPLGAATGTRTGEQLDQLRERLSALAHTLDRHPAMRDLPLAELLSRHGLDKVASRLAAEERAVGALPAPRLRVPDSPATLEPTDLRLPLAILSQSYSSDDNRDVILAQGPGEGPGDGLVPAFRGGTVTLADLGRAGLLRAGDAGPVLTRPLILWEDTRLVLSQGETLALSRPGGAFIASFGQVEITGAEITVDGGPNAHSAEFIPFLVVGGGGMLTMEDATIRGLGFGWTEKFAGVSVVAHPFMPPIGPSRIERSHFDQVVTLALAGTPDIRVTDNRFHDVRDNALRLTRGPRARVQGNLFFGNGPTNAIRLLDGTSDAVMSGNLLLGGTRAGILVGGSSDNVRVVGNVVWRRDGAAIKFLGTACGHVALNIALDGRQKGIEVRQSPGTLVHRNLISGSHSSAIWISAQPRGAVTRLTDNILAGNGEGLATATAQRIVMSGNDFTAQLPRLVSGDLQPQNATLARDLRGRDPMLLTAAGRIDVPALLAACGGEGGS